MEDKINKFLESIRYCADNGCSMEDTGYLLITNSVSQRCGSCGVYGVRSASEEDVLEYKSGLENFRSSGNLEEQFRSF